MTKADLISRVAYATKKDKELVTEILEAGVDQIMKINSEGHDVTWRGFGTFTTAKGRTTARDLKKGTIMHLPERKVPKFKPSPNFKEIVK